MVPLLHFVGFLLRFKNACLANSMLKLLEENVIRFRMRIKLYSVHSPNFYSRAELICKQKILLDYNYVECRYVDTLTSVDINSSKITYLNSFRPTSALCASLGNGAVQTEKQLTPFDK